MTHNVGCCHGRSALDTMGRHEFTINFHSCARIPHFIVQFHKDGLFLGVSNYSTVSCLAVSLVIAV